MKTIHPWNEMKRTHPTTYHRSQLTGAIVRAPHDAGHRLPHDDSAIVKKDRSRYAPHVGKKQLAKMARRSQLATRAA